MTGLPPGNGRSRVAYWFPSAAGRADGDAPFTSWDNAPSLLDVGAWMDPCTIGGNTLKWMYPALIDHDSPFGLSDPEAGLGPGGDAGDLTKSDGLSYSLVGNRSLYIYAVLSRKYIVRVPVAWFLPGQDLPPPPFPPSPPPELNPGNCTSFVVKGGCGVAGTYTARGGPGPDGSYVYSRDPTHQLYVPAMVGGGR